MTADARAAMDLALYELQKGPTPPLALPDLLVPNSLYWHHESWGPRSLVWKFCRQHV